MLRSTFYSFTTALRGLNTAQKQLDVTGQNISNVSTTGYTRQRADTYASSAAGYGDKYASIVNSSLVGQGSVVSGISQIRDPFLDVRFRRESSAVGEQDAKENCMEGIQSIFDEIESSGIMTSFSNFISKLQSLSGNASSSEFDSIARDAASTLVNQLKQYSSQLDTVREEQEYQLQKVTVPKLNDLLTNIANINESIQSQEMAGGSALELKDERNLMLDELSSYVKLDVSYKPNTVANGSTVSDITVNMVGADGSKIPLVYNNVAASFSAALPGDTDASGNTLQEAVVTVDNSDIQAKTILDKVNDAITNISAINTKLNTLYTTYGTAQNKYAADITTAQTNLATAQSAYNTEKAKTTPDKAVLATLSQQISDYNTKISDLNQIGSLLTKRSTAETVLTNNLPAGKVAINNTDANTDGNIDINDYSIVLTNADSTTLTLMSKASGTKMAKSDLLKAGIALPSTTANKVQSQGGLKGTLDMLNSKGTFDYDDNEVRGIGYYEEMLDSLANQFATKMNLLNSITTTTAGWYENVTDSRPLFETSDGSDTITASNIKIADAWTKGTYGITASKTQTTDGSTGASNNILLMISSFSTKFDYKTGPIVAQDSEGNYLDTTGAIFANGRDSDGNYTFRDSAGVTTKVADKNLIDYDTTTGLLKATSLTLNAQPSGIYTDSSGGIIANGKDSSGNYTLIVADSTGKLLDPDGTAPGGTITPTDNGDGTYTDGSRTLTKDSKGNYILKVADSSKTPYLTDGVTLGTGTITLNEQKAITYTDASGDIIANGRDKDGNYTLIVADKSANGLNPDGTTTGSTLTITANSDGTYTDGTRTLTKDSDGNYVVKVANKNTIAYNADGKTLNATSSLKSRTDGFIYNGTYQEFLTNISNVISLDVSSTSNLLANHTTVLSDIQDSRDAISSVSIDEEGINMMQYQKAYNAAARLMTTLDEAVGKLMDMGVVGR